MNIYTDFVMPPFARIQWASKAIKEKYEPLFKKAARFYWIMEKASVEHGLRDVTTEHISPERYPKAVKTFLDRNMFYLPVERVKEYSGYSYYHPIPQPGDKWNYYGVLATNLEKGSEFVESSLNKPSGWTAKIGQLLGYPSCCTTAYSNHVESNSKVRDRTWFNAQKADEKYIAKKEDNLIEIKNLPWQANTLLRNFSLGAIFNIECEIGCPNTLANAMAWYELAEKLGIEGLEEVEMFLRMPMEWDSYKGIAYIKTPLFKAAVNSNMCDERYVVRIQGSYYPDDAVKGLEFPWDIGTKFATVARNGNKLDYQKEES